MALKVLQLEIGRKLCLFLKWNMSNKDIAKITLQSDIHIEMLQTSCDR